ncbi:hypothetical protein GCM10027405_05590 [Arthrobacter alkaliphilus]
MALLGPQMTSVALTLTPSGAKVGAHLMRESICADPPGALPTTTPTTQRTHNFTKEIPAW